MRLTLRDREFAEILVQRDEDAAFSMRSHKNFVIAWISGPIASPDHIMPRNLKRRSNTGPDARVQKDLHAVASTKSGSIRSLPTTRRA